MFVPLKGATAPLGGLLPCRWSALVCEDPGDYDLTHSGARLHLSLVGGRESWRVDDLFWSTPTSR